MVQVVAHLHHESVQFVHDPRYNWIMMTERTYRWYSEHDFSDDRAYDCPHSKEFSIKDFDVFGVTDQVPTLENIRPLLDEYASWWKSVEKDWNNYRDPSNGHLRGVHWTMGPLLKDPTLKDRKRIHEYVVKNHTKWSIPVVGNPSVDESIHLALLNTTKKNDPTGDTKGGEIGCFILFNKNATGRVIDIIARKTKKVKIQLDCARHGNVTKETLVYLMNEGRSSSVKTSSMKRLMDLGQLKVA